MRKPTPLPEGSKEQLLELLKGTKTKSEFQRVQCVLLRSTLGLTPEQIAEFLGWHPVSVRRVQAAYLKQGPTALQVLERGGRYRENISLAEETELLKPFLAQAEAGGIIVVTEIKTAYEKYIGHAVPRSTVYRILERHGWRKLVPRPKHPKGDPAVQDAFKKTSHKRSTESCDKDRHSMKLSG